jgi:choline dehydrogenase
VGYLYCIGNPRTDWLYNTEPDAGLNGRTPALPARQDAGRLQQHQRHDLHARPGARLRPVGQLTGDDSWRWDTRLPYFRRTKTTTAPAAPRQAPRPRPAAWRKFQTPAPARKRHGKHGRRMARGKQRLRWDVLDAFAQAACRRAFRPPTTSTAATTRAWATSRSTRRPAGAGTPPRPFLRPTCYGRPNFEMWTSAQATQAAHRNAADGSRCAAPACRCGTARDGDARARARWC